MFAKELGGLLLAGLAWGGLALSSGHAAWQYVPPGAFQMGDNSYGEVGEGMADERPVHSVTLDGFFIEDHEVTAGLWESVREWAATNGYPDLPALSGLAADEPATGISWYDAVKWCNARSEREGWWPVYFTDNGQTNVYRAGSIDLDAAKWQRRTLRAGYRLPTEAEWERTARGGTAGAFFPWASAGPGSYLDFAGTNRAVYGRSEAAPVGSCAPSGYGLFDMAGSAAEWCWDWYGADYYASFAANAWPDNPCGPAARPVAALRATRGGNWESTAFDVRCAFRDAVPPSERRPAQGLRCAQDFTGAIPSRSGGMTIIVR